MGIKKYLRPRYIIGKFGEYLHSVSDFPIIMLLFTFALIEIVWMIVYFGQSLLFIGSAKQIGQWYLVLLPLTLLLLHIPFRKSKVSRTSRGITLFVSVCIVTLCLVVLGMQSWESFSLGLTLALSVFSGAACGMIMYMDNLIFIRERIELISKMGDSDNRRLAIQQTMQEARAYFDNTMRGIFSILSIIVIVFSVIWALGPDIIAVSNAQKSLWTLASVASTGLLIAAAAVFIGRPASECMSQLSDLLIER